MTDILRPPPRLKNCWKDSNAESDREREPTTVGLELKHELRKENGCMEEVADW